MLYSQEEIEHSSLFVFDGSTGGDYYYIICCLFYFVCVTEKRYKNHTNDV